MKKNPKLYGLRAARKALGWTLNECAARLFVAPRSLSSWELGRCAPPDPERVAAIMGVSVAELLGMAPVDQATVDQAAVDPVTVAPVTVDTEGGESYNGVV